MSIISPGVRKADVVYPECDGIPMADNGKQFVWIVTLYGNLVAAYRGVESVFVCGNQNWFPREGEPEIFKAPDVYVVFGRPKGFRTSWKQWLENDVPMTVVFEVLSPSNTYFEMVDKLQFYDEFGVQEYYVFDPETNRLQVFVRGQAALVAVRFTGSFTSPLMGIRFDLTGPELVVYHADGRRFLTPEELDAERVAQTQSLHLAREDLAATQQSLGTSRAMVKRLAELGQKARRGEATAEEMAELERLERESQESGAG